jgi:hypothetical protein
MGEWTVLQWFNMPTRTTATACHPALRANEQRVLLSFARFARTLLATIASKGQATGRDFARLLAEGLPL